MSAAAKVMALYYSQALLVPNIPQPCGARLYFIIKNPLHKWLRHVIESLYVFQKLMAVSCIIISVLT